MYSGEQGGRAVGEILFGDVKSRRTFAADVDTADLPGFTDYSMSNRTNRHFSGKRQFAFGHGLELHQIQIPGRPAGVKENCRRRHGQSHVCGEEHANSTATRWRRFISAMSSVPQPKLALCGFARVHLSVANSTSRLTFPPSACVTDTEKKQYVVEPGDYQFLIGAASDLSG